MEKAKRYGAFIMIRIGSGACTHHPRVCVHETNVIYRITMKNNSVYETGYISHDSMVFGQKKRGIL